MNKITIIGNLTRDPDLRTTQSGKNVCAFTVAVNKRANGQNEADFFRVTAWDKLGENCMKYLVKGRKVAVAGPVSLNTYTGQDGKSRADIVVTAQDVEFLTPRVERDGQPATDNAQQPAAYTDVTDDPDWPF